MVYGKKEKNQGKEKGQERSCRARRKRIILVKKGNLSGGGTSHEWL